MNWERIKSNAALIVATLALIVAVGTGGAMASGVLITSSHQIRNGVILSADIKNNEVKSADIKNNSVDPADVDLPEPEQFTPNTVSGSFGSGYSALAVVGSYTKKDPSSLLSVAWTGSASAGFEACYFQLRVDGQPAGNAGQAFVGSGSSASISASALFDGLDAGPHQIEVWAHVASNPNPIYPCTIDPANFGIPSTFVVAEEGL